LNPHEFATEIAEMTRIKPEISRSADGAILYDAALFEDVSEALFDASLWPESIPVAGGLRSSGRGNTAIVRGDRGEFVLRHFMRGGLVSRFVGDSYLWLGEDATRAFREWRLLAKLVAMELPVPRPAAARYVRNGLGYRADMLTVRIAGVRSLADRIAAEPCEGNFWEGLGAAIASFHKSGVCHADLNAYNVQLDREDKAWLIDFDRGRLRQPGKWQAQNLARLKRSLEKINGLDPSLRYSDSDWQALLDGYFNSSRFA
jgi:3-deoxy-D-manno-octulosonic acid kinase